MNNEMQDRIVVTIDPDLEDIIPQFMENTRKDISTIACALSENDLETIRRIGHSMKSYGIGYGFDEISAMGKVIEEAALKNNVSTVHEFTGKLANYLDKVTVVYA